MAMRKTTAKTIQAFIKTHPKDVQKLLKQMHSAVKKAAPKATEKISYGMAGFSLNGALVYFNAYAKHLGFYPGPAGIQKFKKQLSKYKLAKGTIQFPLDKKLPVALITKIVRHRVKQNLEKSRKKKD